MASIAHVKTGSRSIVMPGARRRNTVSAMSAASTITATVARKTPIAHRSVPGPGA